MGCLDRFTNLDSASGSEVPAFFSLTPAFSPVDTPHSAQLSRFNGFRMLTTQATQGLTDIGFDTKPVKTAHFDLVWRITGLKAVLIGANDQRTIIRQPAPSRAIR
jgi:hypothetical protein